MPEDNTEQLDALLYRLERQNEEYETQYRRLRNIEGHMELLIQRNRPETFGAWLREADFTDTRAGKARLRHLIERDLLRYIDWLTRLHEAYTQAPDISLFVDAEDEDEA
jgi:hypothetical protein